MPLPVVSQTRRTHLASAFVRRAEELLAEGASGTEAAGVPSAGTCPSLYPFWVEALKNSIEAAGTACLGCLESSLVLVLPGVSSSACAARSLLWPTSLQLAQLAQLGGSWQESIVACFSAACTPFLGGRGGGGATGVR